MMRDHINEGRDDNHAGKWRAFIVSRFRKTFAKPLETYVSKQSATAGMNEIETVDLAKKKMATKKKKKQMGTKQPRRHQ